jgi:hypothetical protein
MLVLVAGGAGAYWWLELRVDDAAVSASGSATPSATPNAPPPSPADPAGSGSSGSGTGTGAGSAGSTPQAGAASTQSVSPGGSGNGAAATATGQGAGAGGAAAPSASKLLVLEQSGARGNNPDALNLARTVATVASKNQLTFAVDATLTPAGSALKARGDKLTRYRKTVSSAVLRIRIDTASMASWNAAKTSVKRTLMENYLSRILPRLYPNAVRSITFVDDQGRLVAIGDAAGSTVSIRVFG